MILSVLICTSIYNYTFYFAFCPFCFKPVTRRQKHPLFHSPALKTGNGIPPFQYIARIDILCSRSSNLQFLLIVSKPFSASLPHEAANRIQMIVLPLCFQQNTAFYPHFQTGKYFHPVFDISRRSMFDMLGCQLQSMVLTSQTYRNQTLKIRYGSHLPNSLVVQHLLYPCDELFLKSMQCRFLPLKAFDEKSCCRRRSFHSQISHPVGYRFITFVTDSGNYRQRELSQVERKVVIVKTPQINLRTTSPNQYYNVEQITVGIDTFQRCNYRLCCFLSLHYCRE